MKKLGQYVVDKGWLTVSQVNQGLRHKRVFGGRLGTCLLELNLISEERLTKALSELLSLPPAPLQALHNIDESARDLIPARVACKSRVVVFESYATEASVCLLDAKDLMLQDELSFIVSKRLKFHAAPEVRILEALERFYQCDIEPRYERIWDRLNRARYLWKEEEEEEEVGGDAGMGRSTGTVWAPEAVPELGRTRGGGEPELPATPKSPESAPSRRPTGPPGDAPGPDGAEVGADASAAGPGTERAPEEVEGGSSDPSAPTPTPLVSKATEAPPAEESPEEPEPSEEPEALEKVSETGSTRPIEPIPVPETPEELRSAMGEAEERDQIASLLLDYLRERFERVLLFMIPGDEVVGWMGAGPEVDQKALQSFQLDFDTPSLFLNLREGSPYFRGPLARMEGHRQIVEILDRRPKDCLALPLEIKDRVVGAVYCDQGGGPMGELDMAEMQGLADITKEAFERLLLRRKREQHD